jgi:hypothetical protein
MLGNALVEHVGHPVGDDRRLARARSRDDEQRPLDRGDGLELLGVELFLIVYLHGRGGL